MNHNDLSSVRYRLADDRRLMVACGISILLHAWAATHWRLPAMRRMPDIAGGLTVTLLKAMPAAPVAPAPDLAAGVAETVSVLSTPLPSPILVPRSAPPADEIRPKRTEKPAKRESPKAEPVASLNQTGSKPNDLGHVRAPVRGPGEVSVMLVIADDGHPGAIIWGRLPALTNEQLRDLESKLRSRTYAAVSTGATITENVDVFALLGIIRK